MENMDYQDMVVAFRKGDEKAFAHVYDLFYGPLYYFIKRILNNADDAEDIAADTFLKLWRLHENFETLQNVKAFLYITARNASLNVLKQRKDYARRNEELGYYLLQQMDGPSAHDEIKADVMKQLLQAINDLPFQCGKIIRLSVEGSRNGEIADALGLTMQTVKNQKSRGLKLLKEALSGREWQLIVLALFGDHLIP